MGIAYKEIMKLVCKNREITVKFGCMINESEYKILFIYREKNFRNISKKFLFYKRKNHDTIYTVQIW